MISKRSCDTENLSNYEENSALHHIGLPLMTIFISINLSTNLSINLND